MLRAGHSAALPHWGIGVVRGSCRLVKHTYRYQHTCWLHKMTKWSRVQCRFQPFSWWSLPRLLADKVHIVLAIESSCRKTKAQSMHGLMSMLQREGPVFPSLWLTAASLRAKVKERSDRRSEDHNTPQQAPASPVLYNLRACNSSASRGDSPGQLHLHAALELHRLCLSPSSCSAAI